MKIRALAPWFGGKRTLAPAIVQQLGKHTQYFEPFCGSMAEKDDHDRLRDILFAYHKARIVVS